MNTVEVIKEGEIIRMSESQARDEDLFVLRRVIEQEPERVEVDYKASFRANIPEAKPISKLEQWRAGRFAYKRNNVINDLIPNFHWEIARGRRKKDITGSLFPATSE